jgi:exonuclease SbcC
MILSNNDRKIKTIELTNFMNHVYTKIDLEDGINLITGSSDNGKSAILRALYSVFLDKHDSGWIRDGEKEYTVKITFFNGDTFERTKGKRNILKKTTFGGETTIAQSYGKDMPEDYKKFLGVIPETSDGPLPFSFQKKDIFLVDKKELSLGQEISVLLQVDDLEKGASNLKKEITRFNTQTKDLQNDKQKLETDLEQFSDLDRKLKLAEQLDKILNAYDELLELMQRKQSTLSTCLNIVEEVSRINKILKQAKNVFKLLTTELNEIEAQQLKVDEKNEMIDSAISFIERMEEIDKDKIIANEFVNGVLGQTVTQIIETEKTVSDKKVALDEVSSIEQETRSIDGFIDNLQTEIEAYDKEIDILIERQKTTTSICPTCEGDGFVTSYKVEANVE